MKMQGTFAGWYFKHQTPAETLALIPAIHADAAGHRQASLQVITRTATYCAQFPGEAFHADQSGPRISIGNNVFSPDGVHVDVHADGLDVVGDIAYGRFSPLHYDIMGPFSLVPFMECRHGVVSLTHPVRGAVAINGRVIDLSDATGYIEADRGRSFPTRYLWTQHNWHADAPCSLMLSVADIPFLGARFTGVIGVVLWQGREYRLATYLGARAATIGQGAVTVRQGGSVLTARLLERHSLSLRAPVHGGMTRLIRENPACRVQYEFRQRGRVTFGFEADQASFEYEYDH
jgi:hypothetical protein